MHVKCQNIITANPLLSPSGGIFTSNQFDGGGGYLRGGGGLINLEKTMVSATHKELEYKVERLKYKRLEVMQPRIRIKSQLPVGK